MMMVAEALAPLQVREDKFFTPQAYGVTEDPMAFQPPKHPFVRSQ